MSFASVLSAERRLLASVKTREEVYERVHEAARDLVPMDAFYVCLYEPKNRRLRFERNGDESGLDTPETFTLGDGPTSRAIRTGKPHVLNHLHDEAAVPIAFGDPSRRTHGAIHLPFWSGGPGAPGMGAPLGVISVQSYTLDAYDRGHVAAVRWLAARTAHLLGETEAQTAREAARMEAEAACRAQLRRNVAEILASHHADPSLKAAILAVLATNDRVETLDARVLTDRELQSVALAAQGLSYARTADALGIGMQTVKTHVSRAFAKLGLPDGRTLPRHLPTLLAALGERGL